MHGDSENDIAKAIKANTSAVIVQTHFTDDLTEWLKANAGALTKKDFETDMQGFSNHFRTLILESEKRITGDAALLAQTLTRATEIQAQLKAIAQSITALDATT